MVDGRRSRSTIFGATIWPTSMPISIVPVAFLLVGRAALRLLPRAALQGAHGPRSAVRVLQPASGARSGTARSRCCCMAMGQVAFLLVMSVVLQDGRHLSRDRHRALAGAVGRRDRRRLAARQLADPPHRHDERRARRTVPRGHRARRLRDRRHADAVVPRAAARLHPGRRRASASPVRSSTTSSSPTCRPKRSGAASGANTTVRMIGASLGIAVISSMLSTQTSRSAVVDAAHTPLIFAAVVLYFAFASVVPDPARRSARQPPERAQRRRLRARAARVGAHCLTAIAVPARRTRCRRDRPSRPR